MRRRRLIRRPWLTGFAAMLLFAVLAVTLTGRSESEDPASRAALDHIAAKNREAAILSAARLKAESNEAAAAADARFAAEMDEVDVAEADSARR